MSEPVKVGTRGSELALRQVRWVCDRLRAGRPDLHIEEVVIKTHGDEQPDRPIDENWPAGGFVGAIETALVDGRINFAVHSFKDLPTQTASGLIVVAVPEREVVHDVLVVREPIGLESLPRGFRIGTSSPRRAAQLRRHAPVEIVPIRGNVRTRLMKMERDGLDAVVLAAAGLKRLTIDPPHRIDLPTDRFVPAPGQGALAVQTRRDAPRAFIDLLLLVLDDEPSHRRVDAERAFLAAIGPGCHTPVAALAEIEGDRIRLHGQLFSDDEVSMVEDTAVGTNPIALGAVLAKRLRVRV